MSIVEARDCLTKPKGVAKGPLLIQIGARVPVCVGKRWVLSLPNERGDPPPVIRSGHEPSRGSNTGSEGRAPEPTPPCRQCYCYQVAHCKSLVAIKTARLRTHCGSQKMTVAAMQMADMKV